MVLAGCSTERRPAESGATNINAAAVAAQDDIDTYAAGALQATPPAAAVKPTSAPAPVEKVAANPNPAPSPEPAVATTRPTPVREAATTERNESYRCAGQTRVSTRADDSEFERAARDAPDDQRPGGGVWQKGNGQDVRADRDALDHTAPAGCTAN